MRSGKSYYQIMRVFEEAKRRGPEVPTIYVSSEEKKRQMEELANAMGYKVEVRSSKAKP